MKQIRLLPVVIAATTALLLLKGLGIMTQGGYVLTGTEQARAASGGDGAGSADVGLPTEQTLFDSAPTLDDGAPTMPLREGQDHGSASAVDHAEEGADESGGFGDVPDLGEHVEDVREVETTVAVTECPPGSVLRRPVTPDGEQGGGGECVVDPGANEMGDALPMIRDDAGNIVPLATADGSPSSAAIAERLVARRLELDEREAELQMRLALVEAAERRISERTQVLEQLEARINAMVDEKRTLEEAQFTAVVAMYETMRPRDAAAIFDQLELSVLVRVARAVNPRKMAPIMASMNPSRAKDLTSALAVDRVEPTIDIGAESLAHLPQIVGQ